MKAAPDPTFSTAQVCAAAGLARVTFDAWLLRKYLPLPPGPGTGRSRSYSQLDAVRIAVVAELTRMGVSIGIAANAASKIKSVTPDRQSVPRAFYEPWVLLMGHLAHDPHPERDVMPPSIAIARLKSWDELHDIAIQSFGSASFVTVDLSALIPRVLTRLEQHPV